MTDATTDPVFGGAAAQPMPSDPRNLSAEDRLQLMRAPFALNERGLLPKQLSKDDQSQPEWCKAGSNVSADGRYCGGRHKRSVHLDYVGHAAITNRLLEIDPHWSWEPAAFDASGLPAFDAAGGLWIKLTVCGVTRLGYGDGGGKRTPDGTKEAIGDALRNASMRFGAGLELWHKGDLSAPGTLEEANTPAEKGGRDWYAEAQQMGEHGAVLALWNEAQQAGVPVEELDKIAGLGTRLARQQKGGQR